ncbi:hypothetical protein GCK32_008582 [Trichostrongylus colubriformis]|uniref:DUF7774 domain-containing protein n=1 Tax=Trichostrongylus colubriformis TaxID=6319 RepID=A0AAN8FJ62_TRICO
MEMELKKARETIIFLQSKLQRRDNKIAQLRSLITKQEAELRKYKPGRISQIPHDDYDNAFSDKQIALAVEVLEKLKRNQLLENSLSSEENKILTKYFTSSDLFPTNDVVMLIDKAISYALDVIVNRTELCDEHIDNELRNFLIDTGSAKLVILDVMLARPDFVPDNWGGRAINKKALEKSPKGLSTSSTSKSRSPSTSSSSSSVSFHYRINTEEERRVNERYILQEED